MITWLRCGERMGWRKEESAAATATAAVLLINRFTCPYYHPSLPDTPPYPFPSLNPKPLNPSYLTPEPSRPTAFAPSSSP